MAKMFIGLAIFALSVLVANAERDVQTEDIEDVQAVEMERDYMKTIKDHYRMKAQMARLESNISGGESFCETKCVPGDGETSHCQRSPEWKGENEGAGRCEYCYPKGGKCALRCCAAACDTKDSKCVPRSGTKAMPECAEEACQAGGMCKDPADGFDEEKADACPFRCRSSCQPAGDAKKPCTRTPEQEKKKKNGDGPGRCHYCFPNQENVCRLKCCGLACIDSGGGCKPKQDGVGPIHACKEEDGCKGDGGKCKDEGFALEGQTCSAA
eukprot:TRINITY_DN94239_c0_g1_i1.p1 TRINITY_DN94239_c0_g1~~TRINITY_DN94239_c0_g1_i1.p1  ORF type:complete len:269 (+),score=44.63 TRINITY_DN94239_c0_g1_i1:82-888(+)